MMNCSQLFTFLTSFFFLMNNQQHTSSNWFVLASAFSSNVAISTHHTNYYHRQHHTIGIIPSWKERVNSIKRGGGLGGSGGDLIVRKESGGDDIVKVKGGGDDDDVGKATMPEEIANLVKSIVGSGVLSLPAGIAAFGNAPSALIPATILISTLGLLSAYTFSLIARVCSYTSATSYSDAWDKTRGSSTAWFISLSSLLDCFLGNLGFSMILADTFRDLLAGFGVGSFSRGRVLLGVTGLALLPLCLVRNLSGLAPFSVVGIMGMLYTSVAIAVRFFGGEYALPDGRFLGDLSGEAMPSFGNVGAMGVFRPSSLILVCMLSNAYIAHFNSPKFFVELKNNTMERFNVVVGWGFGISILIYAVVSALAFLTFGSNSLGLILNNYSNKDAWMSISRIAVALSVLTSYPLLFVGTRDGLLDLLKIPSNKRTNTLQDTITIVTLSIITAMAFKLRDVSFVASICGATFGTSLVFVYPTLMFRKAAADLIKGKEEGDDAKKRLERERGLAGGIALGGVLVSIIGLVMTLKDYGYM